MFSFKSLLLTAAATAMAASQQALAVGPACPKILGEPCPDASCLSDPANWDFQLLTPIHGGEKSISATLKNCLSKKKESLETVLAFRHPIEKCNSELRFDVAKGERLVQKHILGGRRITPEKCGGRVSLYVFDKQYINNSQKDGNPGCKQYDKIRSTGLNACQQCTYEDIQVPVPEDLCLEIATSGPCDGKAQAAGLCNPLDGDYSDEEEETPTGPCDGKAQAAGLC